MASGVVKQWSKGPSFKEDHSSRRTTTVSIQKDMWSARLNGHFPERQRTCQWHCWSSKITPSITLRALFPLPDRPKTLHHLHNPIPTGRSYFVIMVLWLCFWHLFFFLSACSMNVHHKCQTKVANLCGVNQKLMAEALAMIESTQQVNTLGLEWPGGRRINCSMFVSLQEIRALSGALWVTSSK